MTERTRAEHVEWCKARAREYLDAGDPKNAFASMGSDMQKHPETRKAAQALMMLGVMHAAVGDIAGVRRWVEGFK
jgi:hypothetical protein